jgi:5-methylcytosine-specific restriction endonuclease McrA
MSRTKISNALKKQVSDRARGCCEYCKSQRKFSPSSFEIEHIIPISRGGTNKSRSGNQFATDLTTA